MNTTTYGTEVRSVSEPYEFTVTECELQTRTDAGLHVPRKKAIVRDDTQEVLGIVSDTYNVLPHSQALNPLLEVLERRGSDVHKNIRLTKGGARMYANLYLKDHDAGLPSDTIWPGVTVINSLDGSQKYRAELAMFRLVCTNGLTIPQTVASFSTRHSKNATFEMAVEEILRVIEDPKTFEFISKLNRLEGPGKKNEEQLTAAIETVCDATGSFFPKRYSDDIVRYYKMEHGVSMWNFYNAFNSVLEHEINRGKGKLERARALDVNLFETFMRLHSNS